MYLFGYRTTCASVRIVRPHTASPAWDMISRMRDRRALDKPERFDGDMLLFVAMLDRQGPRPVPQAIASWEPYVGGRLESHEVNCSHYAMLQPGPLEKIGKVISAKLAMEKASARKG